MVSIKAGSTHTDTNVAGVLKLQREPQAGVLTVSEVMPAGAAAQFFCEVPSQSGTSGELGLAGDTYDECVYREDTLVLLELTTRDMMEARFPALVFTTLSTMR